MHGALDFVKSVVVRGQPRDFSVVFVLHDDLRDSERRNSRIQLCEVVVHNDAHGEVQVREEEVLRVAIAKLRCVARGPPFFFVRAFLALLFYF